MSPFETPRIDAVGYILFVNVFLYPVFLIGLTSNSLLIYIMLKFPNLNIVTRVYLINRAVVDILLVINIPAKLSTEISADWNLLLGSLSCRIVLSVPTFNSIVSLLFVSALLLDLLFAKCTPFTKKRWRTHGVVITVAIILWLLSAYITYPSFENVQRGAHAVYPYQLEESSIVRDDKLAKGSSEVFLIYSLFLCYIIPLKFLPMIFLWSIRGKCTRMWKRDMQTGGEVAGQDQNTGVNEGEADVSFSQNMSLTETNEQVSNNDNEDSVRTNGRKRENTKLTCAMIGLYLLVNLPILLSQIHYGFGHAHYFYGERNKAMQIMAYYATYSIPVMHPVLVIIVSDDVKKSIRKIFCKESSHLSESKTKLTNFPRSHPMESLQTEV